MTEEQAIIIRSCYANGVKFKESCGISNEYHELALLMNSAIKKQIPQKPIKADEQDIRYCIKYFCPNCGKSFIKAFDVNYCYKCGQAFSWEMSLDREKEN